MIEFKSFFVHYGKFQLLNVLVGLTIPRRVLSIYIYETWNITGVGGMNLPELRRWIPIIIVCAIIMVLIPVWYFTFPASAWADTPNYLHMYADFVINRPLNAFLTVNTGLRGTVAWVFIPVYLVTITYIILYFIEKKRNQQYIITTKYYLIYLVILALFAISFQNASQYYGWYWNPTLNAPGYVDTWTHITSMWLFGALIAPLAIERFFGWDRKSMWFFIFGILAIIALCWEIGETVDAYYLRPQPGFFNYPMDSLKDMIMGAGMGTLLSCFIYELLVTDLGE
ncbi:MAG TPA: hypothetical protein VMS95_00390 [Candidatus Krumholzibacteriaceae bacterium]|nr:hypothetical protein [Candidatus Krumholzibacteriaceae bacterium]